MLVEIWRDVLGQAEVGVHENFFDLGGTSQAVATVLATLNERLDRPLRLVALYEFPTIAALAGHLGTDRPDDQRAEPDPHRAERLRAGRARVAERRSQTTR
jgi:hypothetical protein